MPISKANRGRYPKDWKSIVAQVRERSGHRCEGSPAFPDCRVPNGAVGYRYDDRWIQLGDSPEDAGLAVDAAYADGFNVIRIVLTIGHLDHTPEHCELANLRHWCQRCHLTYDAAHHAETRAATKRKQANTMELFE
jgi:hypothetical protein